MIKRSGGKVPTCFVEHTSLASHLRFYFTAFLSLDTERSVGMGIGRIPWRAIVAYAHEYGLYGTRLDSFVYKIERMDAAMVNKLNAEQKKDGS